jgi:hypothetical protein
MIRFACYFSDYPDNVTYLWAPGVKAALRKFAQMKGYRWVTANMKAVKA